MIFQQIRSATIKIQYPNVTFMIDPWLSDPCTNEEKEAALKEKRFITKPIVPLPLPVKDILSDVDVCIVSHDHADHFSTDYLPKDMHMIFQNQKDEALGKSLGFTNTEYFEKDMIQIEDIKIYRTDGRHGDTDELAKKAGPVSGFVFVKEGEKTIWVAGDTVYCDIVEKVIDTYHPDIIIVNACDAHTRSGRLIMNTEDVIKTCKYAPGSIVVASHMDTVSHAHLTRKELQDYLIKTPYEKQVLIPLDGEKISF